jgi:hypothetical protein
MHECPTLECLAKGCGFWINPPNERIGVDQVSKLISQGKLSVLPSYIEEGTEKWRTPPPSSRPSER